ncbi:hypothetical protein QYF36_024753 [Acer negundo]|nr:hypothetical protein QYF36_024753 [Acer negundo]
MNFPRESLDGWRWQGSMRARCLSYYFTESEPTVGREKRMDASDYRIAGDAHRTAGGRSNHNQYLIENPISPEAVLEKEKEFILAFIPPVRRKTWKSRITRHRLDRTVLQYPSILKASILVLCSYPLSTPSPSFSSINPTASLHSSLCFGSSPLHRSLSLPLLVCFFWELRLLAVPSTGFSRRWDPIPSFTSQQSMQLQPVALSFGFIYEQNRIWIASSEVGDGNMGSAVLGRGLNIDLVSYRPSLNRLSPAARAIYEEFLRLSKLALVAKVLRALRRVRAWLDPVSSPGRVGGEDWQSSSFSGGVVFIERKASPKEWQIWMAWKQGRSG